MQEKVDQLGRAIASKSFPLAVTLLHESLSGFGHYSQSKQSSSHVYQQLSYAIGQLFINKAFTLERAQYHLLCANHSSISMAFSLAGFQNADHVFMQIADVSTEQGFSFQSDSDLMKCLLLFSSSSDYPINLHSLSKQIPELATPLLMGLIASRMQYDKKSFDYIGSLLEKDWAHLEKFQPTLAEMLGMSNSWMYCSYSNNPEKHNIKTLLNRIIGNWEGFKKLPEFTKDNNRKSTRKILIPLESFRSDHAMYRCFERVIKQLSKNYETIALCPEHCIDDISRRCFSDVITFEPGTPFTQTQSFIEDLRTLDCDMVYYPSLGMANFTLLLASQRLAPVQCFTLGHPATSHFPEIDYVIVQEQDYSCADIYSETVILTGNETSSTINQVAKEIISTKADDGVFHIAITSTFMKINADFLETCNKIRTQSNKEICFHIFPAVSGHLQQHLETAYRNILGHIKIYPATDYSNYINWLAQCEIRLGTFPFGGANSNMDCFGLAMPFIALAGDEPHAQSDIGQLQQAHLLELVADNIDDYVDKAVRLIEDNDYRHRIKIKMEALKNRSFFNGEITADGAFVKTMSWLLNNHNTIKSKKQKVWTIDTQ